MAPGVVEQHVRPSRLSTSDVTFATPGTPSDEGQPASIQPPLEPATVPESKTQNDSIREHYPDATRAKFGDSSPSVTVDPINVNVGSSVIWHPGVLESSAGHHGRGKRIHRHVPRQRRRVGPPAMRCYRGFLTTASVATAKGFDPSLRRSTSALDLRGRIYPPPAAPRSRRCPTRSPMSSRPSPPRHRPRLLPAGPSRPAGIRGDDSASDRPDGRAAGSNQRPESSHSAVQPGCPQIRERSWRPAAGGSADV